MVNVDLQNDDKFESIPSIDQFLQWVESSLLQPFANLEQTIRVVSESESQELNRQFRSKDKSTNVLSFPSDDDYLEYNCLGDLVICVAVVESEALLQGKACDAHWAHMVVHGMLHLQGFDHQHDDEAHEMEALEIKILSTLGYNSPYNEL
ncbi:MAG: putative rRNA maturation factor [Gammaproteobacteria bacterium]|jgi:probable rRNA maturation factor